MKFSTEKFGGNETQRNETLFTLGNGNLGFRGDTEEKAGTFHKGTYINGFYESESILYGESAYGYAKNHETIVNLPDPKRIELTLDSIPFNLEDPGKIKKYLLTLDTQKGSLERITEWNDGKRSVLLRSERLVSFAHEDTATIRYSIMNTSSKELQVGLKSFIDVKAKNILAKDDPRIGAKFRHEVLQIQQENPLAFFARTVNSSLSLAGTCSHKFFVENQLLDFDGEKNFCLKSGESFVLEKYISYVWQKDGDESRLRQMAFDACKKALDLGFDRLLDEQKNFLSDFWKVALVQIEGDRASEEALEFNLFHLLQSASRNGRASIAAKGLSSEGYEGHFFWDSESYACPLFTYTFPLVAKSLLEYRARILPKALERASVMNLKGALFPWRTISGEETSAYFPAGTAQYHIDADIIFALNKYLNAHEDGLGFEKKDVEELCAQTARMWLSLGHFSKSKDGAFCIEDVTGPDEYTAIVNNNAFTNLMARENLEIALKRSGNKACEKERNEWKLAAEKMYIPYDYEAGIIPQDDSFMDKADWDFKNTPKENYPLLLHYHPLVIYRHRVLKQPDLVLAQFLLAGRFTLAEKIRNFNFYEKYTTGDSSLSHCIMSIMASVCGEREKALEYFNKTARMDIDDVNGNSRDGIHTACMAGSWMSVVYGFAGFSDYGGKFSFNPQIPSSWKKLKFSLALKGSILDVTLTHDAAEYSLRKESAGLSLRHRNVEFTLGAGEKKTFGLAPKLGALLFDLDGVITNTAELHYKAWKEMADREGLAFNQEINKKLLGISREASLAVILKANNAVWSKEKKDKACYEKNERYKELISSLGKGDVLPGIENLLKEAYSQGIKCALASSSKNAPAIIKALGLEKYFECSLKKPLDFSGGIKAKPQPDIFLNAAESAGVWYTDCLGIEDARSGVCAIKSAGIKACGLKSSGDDVSAADIIFDSTKDLSLEKLKKLFC
ncbi:MAG: beta-phosphoglucomutase [Treponema sp.]|nr:beta-phosphoglucomutase [Treponema sp.]